jgi:four helix bundle protein
MAKSIVGDKSYQFAIDIVNAYSQDNSLKGFFLSKQLIRSGTSIGANIAEANGAFSKKDFSSKMSIAYKESLETKYWLRLFKDTKLVNEENFDRLFGQVEEISRMLFSILRTTHIAPKTDN